VSVSSPLATEGAKDRTDTDKPEKSEEKAEKALGVESLQEATQREDAHAADQAPADAGEHGSTAVATEDNANHDSVPAIQGPHIDGDDAGSTNEKAGPTSSTENLPSAGETNSLALEEHLGAPTPPPAADSEAASVAPSSIRHSETKEGSLQDVSLVNHYDAAQDEETHVQDSPEDASEAEDERELGTYVGNASWEERTWKELVKLREEMFWARIGGVR